MVAYCRGFIRFDCTYRRRVDQGGWTVQQVLRLQVKAQRGRYCGGRGWRGDWHQCAQLSMRKVMRVSSSFQVFNYSINKRDRERERKGEREREGGMYLRIFELHLFPRAS